MVRILFSAGAQVDCVANGSTPLILVCYGGESEEMVGTLLKAEADPNKRSEICAEGTPLHMAAASEKARAVELLLQHSKIDTTLINTRELKASEYGARAVQKVFREFEI